MKNIAIILIILNFVSCTDLLKESPEIFIAPDAFYNNIDEATAAIYGVYDMLPGMYGRSQHITSFADVASNSFVVTSASATDFQPFDIHSVGPSNSSLTNFWISSYNGINRANSIIARVPLIDANENDKNILIGEAKFLRGLFYFNLVRLFGDIPLVLEETTSLENLEVSRISKGEIYQQIILDLNESKSLLPSVPLEVGRASKYASSALLSKVFLTEKDFENALINSKEVVNSNEFSLWDEYKEAFLESNDNGKESIFAVQFRKDVDGNSLIGWSMPPLLNNYVEGSPLYDLMIVSEELFNSYESGDKRKELNAVTQYTTASGEVIEFEPFCFKYADGVFNDTGEAYNQAYNSGVNYQILRFADILLVLAESENEVSGPTDLAYEAVNMVRRRAFGKDLDTPSSIDLEGLSQEELRNAIWEERFRELPFEGNQWFDLVRTNRAEIVLGIQQEKTIYPIPQREMDVNSLLTQNPGY